MRVHYSAFALLAITSLIAMACGGGSDSVPNGETGERLDGQTIVAGDDSIVFGARVTEGEGAHGLYLVRASGSELQKLTDEPGYIFFPRWSPRGDRIAYIVGVEGEESPGTLRVFDLETGQAATVSEEALPSVAGPAVTWSGDGSRVAFAEGGGLRVYDVDRGELVELPETPGVTPDWSAARDELVFVSIAEGGATELFVMDADGGDARRLTERSGTERNPRWSPDGERVLFSTGPDGEPDASDVVVVERDGGELTVLGAGADGAWSPDGGRIAYSGRSGGNTANRELFLVTVEGGGARRLSEEMTVTRDVWPAWAPGGDLFAFVAQIDRLTALLCVAELEPLDRDCLDLPGLLPGAPAWRP